MSAHTDQGAKSTIRGAGIGNPVGIWTYLALNLGLVLGLIIVIGRDVLVPIQYKFDSIKIQELSQGGIGNLGDTSFENVASIYRWLGLANADLLASLIGFMCGYLTLILAVRRARRSPIELNSTSGFAARLILIVISCILNAVYLGTYSKDLFVLPIIAVILVAPDKWRWDIVIMLVTMAYAVIFRQYWLIVFGLYPVIRIVTRRGIQLGRIIFTSLVGLVAAGIVISVVLQVAPDYFRVVINETRTIEAASQISQYIPGGTLAAGLLNLVITFFMMMFPLTLLTTAGFSYMPIFMVFLGIWIPLLLELRANRANARNGLHYQVILSRCVSLIFAFLVTEALFEPDFGSAIRHLTPVLPLFVFVLMSSKGYYLVSSSNVVSLDNNRGFGTRSIS